MFISTVAAPAKPFKAGSARLAFYNGLLAHKGKSVAVFQAWYLANYATIHGQASVYHPKSTNGNFGKTIAKVANAKGHGKAQGFAGWLNYFTNAKRANLVTLTENAPAKAKVQKAA